MTDKGKPFFPGEYQRWTFEVAHPSIERLEMKVTHFQGSRHQVGQDKIEKIYTEKNMPHELFCSACDGGGLDLSKYLKNLEYDKTTERQDFQIRCRGTFGRSPKGRNPGQACSLSDFNIHTKIVYKKAEDKHNK